ncbi:iron-sulfur cluster assembly scaffold protein [Mangrovihabitans endophyticus]|uniref:Similarity with Nitrogen-fixing NifU-like proteins n=1 Tax=Mangrovihabitans endophyticus TaxID=1751298 RepID=A0A8J3BUE6_9ACTN|nr:iron-sulfur cluster assembly scaffold protein [Mangrovihabitans endophyticus]GGK78266.1 similarity with Nitrogen-fixing NifU-like proteins [Mangrovihabitans endophyticus]
MGRFSATVVDHFTNPRNLGEIDDADVRAFVGNPVCGDQILLTANVAADDVVSDIRFQAFGCSASLAVASLLTATIHGSPLGELTDLDAARLEELAGGLAPDQRHVAALGADVAHRLVNNFRRGANDDDPISCSV